MAGPVADATIDMNGEVTDAPAEDHSALEVEMPAPALPSSRGAVVLVALALIVAVLATVSVVLLRSDQGRRDEQARGQDVLVTAHQVAVDLVTLRYGSARDDLDQILASTTGDFRQQFADVSGSFEKVLGDGQVQSTGQVELAGISKIDDGQATVLAAVTSTVKNTEAPDGERRTYRMRLTLDNIDGDWLVSNVEFVA
ncbi:hypothetical protein [Rhodococcus sp. YH3-3]|uniref:hypothetical protein n=1 Tax=Rhodococcus sp. YH3-3 TaxID=1803579 RepID=UPI0007DB4792|nr:hypothetical protein [Rhodococcus sp. YH3-3]